MPSENDPCRFCQTPGPHVVTVVDKGVHYAKLNCVNPQCRLFLGWLPKPSNDKSKYRRPASHKDLVGKFSRGYCEMCRRKEGELPKGQTLEAQHVQEYQDGGEPTRENIWILCTGCHRLVHWVRTYHGGLIAELAESTLVKEPSEW